MNGGQGAQRGVSDIVGLSLIFVFAIIASLLLVAGAWSVVGGLTTETTESLTVDSMHSLDEGIAEVSDASESKTVSVEFPEGSGESLEAEPSEGELNLTITANATFWNRTVAEGHGHNRTGANVTVLGTVRQESDHHGTVAYQGGGLFQRPTPDGETFVLSDPAISVTGDSVDLGMVSLSDTGAITEGSQMTIRRDPAAGDGDSFQEFIARYYTDRYNPATTVPIRTNLTIESQYADGWATYAEKNLGHAEEVIYPYDGDDRKVRIVLGEIGDPPMDTHDPAFGDDDILYAGSSDLAYLYHNDSAHGGIEENHTAGPMSPNIESVPTDDEYKLALYNESGRWLVYNTSTDRWETAHGEVADPANTAALNTSAGPGNAVDDPDQQFFIDPPSWVAESPTTPICVVTNTSGISTAEMSDYIDENGADCLDTMVGVDTSLVGPIPEYPEFNVTVETDESDLNETYTTNETVEVEVNVTNEGEAEGQTPLGVYIINETNYPHVDDSNTTFVNGTAATDLERDPGENVTKEYTFETVHPMAGQNWTAFTVLGGGQNDTVTNATTGDAGFFEVVRPDAQLDIVEVTPSPDPVDSGNTQVVEVRINESEELISDPVTQYLTLHADGRLVNQTEITYASGENSTRQIAWEPRSSDAGSVDLNVSTYDDTNTTSVIVVDTTPLPANFAVGITGTNSSIKEGQNLTVDLNVTNTGGQTATQEVVLHDMDGNPVDATALTLDPGDSAYPTLQWQTVYGENGTGTVRAASEDDSDTAPVNVTELDREPRDPIDLVFVMDESGSMGSDACDGCARSRAKAAVDAAQDAVGNLNHSKDRAGVTFFESWARQGTTNGNLLATDYSTSGINDTIATLSAGGGTRSDLGIDEALDIFDDEASDSHEKVMIVMSDGANNGCKPADNGGDYSLIQNDDPYECDANNQSIDLVQDATDDDITTHSVSYGNANTSSDDVEIDVAFMEEIAAQGNGNYYHATNDSQLTEVFDEITNEITDSNPSFEVDILSTNDPVSEGDTVEVDVTVTNTGASGESVVVLEGDSGDPVDSKLVDLDSGESTTVTLEWDTTGVSTPPPQQTVTVRSGADSDTKSGVMVTPSAGGGPQLEVTSLSATPSPLIASNTLTVDATIENTGGADATNEPVSLSVIDQSTSNTIAGNSTTVSVDAGNTKTVSLAWDSDPGDAGSYDLEVETPDDTGTTTVTVDPPMSTNLDVSIVNADDPVQAGGELDVYVELENTGSETENGTVVLRDNRTGEIVDMAVDLTVSGGGAPVEKLIWDTRVGQGDDTPFDVRAELANKPPSTTEQVEIREAETNLDDASLASGTDPVDINLDEIQLDS